MKPAGFPTSNSARLVKKVLQRNLPAGRLAVAAGGVTIGLFLMMLCLQLVLGIQNFLGQPDGSNGSFLILNKPVKSPVFSRAPAEGFEATDLELLQSQPWVMAAAGTRPNLFKVFAGLGFTGGGIGSEVFFEAVPDRFLDVVPEGWNWQPGQPVPILLSRDFLNLYNFGFAGSRGLPQVTPVSAGLVPVTLTLSGPHGYQDVPARIAGFSDRISSIVAPRGFVDWANLNLVGVAEPKPLRLVVQVRDPADPAIRAFLAAQGWETNNDRLRLSRLALLAQILVGLLALIGVGMAVLGLFLVHASLRLYAADQRDNLELLLDLGASPTWLTARLNRLRTLVLLPAGFAAGAAGWLAAVGLEQVFAGQGLSLSLFSPLAGLVLPLVVALDAAGRLTRRPLLQGRDKM